jgi:hypothetical protein
MQTDIIKQISFTDTNLMSLQGQQLGSDDLVIGLESDRQGFAVVVAGGVLDQQVDHAHVAVPAGFDETGRPL